jgi:dTDP-glucose 4,6-dehydratase
MSPPLFPEDLDHILDHTRDLWEELRGERLFITGGTGFFGCWLLESFAWANRKLNLKAHLVALTRDPEAFTQKAPHLAADPAITLLRGDVRNFEFPPGSFPFIIHAATESSTKLNTENPLLMLDTIVVGTRQTLNFAAQAGAKKFLLTSSGAVYGKQPPELTHIPEDYPGAPDAMDLGSAYGLGKRMAEHLCALYARQTQIEMKIARCFAFVGPHLPLETHFAIGNFIRDALHGGPIVVMGDGTPLRSYLYAADLVIWLWTILFRGKSCRPYNVGSMVFMAIKDIACYISQEFITGLQVDIRGGHFISDSFGYVPRVQRANEELGLIQIIDLHNAISKTIRWYAGNGKPQ